MLEKIGESKITMCKHPEHEPPNAIVLEPGTYRHTCPGCKRTFTFVVPVAPQL